MIHTEKKEIDVTYLTCDVCGERIDTTCTHFSVCDGCNIHLCSKCRIISPREMYEGFGDYTPFVCKQCHNIAKEEGFNEEMTAIAERIEYLNEEEDKIVESWRASCKKAKLEKLEE